MSTTPPSGDTTGYWQQSASYTIVARLDEKAQAARATGDLVYVNHSPDTLREMFVYQYLNAFRPGSRWSASDEREGRTRFQKLKDPDYGYERFTAAPTVDGTPVTVTYPFAPDSTVAHIALPRALAPGATITVHFAWESRPSATVYRRQGRKGRHYDFAQWYPKVAVYDRLGWEVNPLVPAGELYGEFGTFDVTIVAKNDQVLGATGVPVEGDPGWERVLKWGRVNIRRDAYGTLPPTPAVQLDSGERAVRFYARDIHHFAWTASPDYLYEGATYHDSIAIHALYEPNGAKGWGQGIAIAKQARALAWLESIYGPYAYPQVLGTQRLDGGATEFPMMVMYGTTAPSDGLVLHETGHIYSIRHPREQRVAQRLDGRGAHELPDRVGAGSDAAGAREGTRPQATAPAQGLPRTCDHSAVVGAVRYRSVRPRAHRTRGTDRHAGPGFQRVRDLQRHGVHARTNDVQRAARDARRQRVPSIPEGLLRDVEAEARR